MIGTILSLTLAVAPIPNIRQAIDRSAAKYNIQPELLQAIIQQESGFRNGIVACYGRKLPGLKISGYTCDVGIAQINWESWGERLHLNFCRLKNDPVYAIDVAAKILSIVRKGHENEDNWWSLYHDNRAEEREVYELAVARWLPVGE